MASNISKENNILETGIEIVFQGIIITSNDWNDWKFLEKNDNWLEGSNYKLTFSPKHENDDENEEPNEFYEYAVKFESYLQASVCDVTIELGKMSEDYTKSVKPKGLYQV